MFVPLLISEVLIFFVVFVKKNNQTWKAFTLLFHNLLATGLDIVPMMKKFVGGGGGGGGRGV